MSMNDLLSAESTESAFEKGGLKEYASGLNADFS